MSIPGLEPIEFEHRLRTIVYHLNMANMLISRLNGSPEEDDKLPYLVTRFTTDAFSAAKEFMNEWEDGVREF